MIDILKKQRNPISTTFKRIYVHKANRTLKDLIHQNKGFKRTKSFRPSNRRRRPDRGSSYNTLFKNDDNEVSKDVETEPKSNPDPKLKSFTYIIKNFDLDDNKSNCFISSLNFKNNVEDSKTKDNYLTAFNRSKKPLKRSPNKPNLLLYNTGTTDHIIKNRK